MNLRDLLNIQPSKSGPKPIGQSMPKVQKEMREIIAPEEHSGIIDTQLHIDEEETNGSRLGGLLHASKKIKKSNGEEHKVTSVSVHPTPKTLLYIGYPQKLVPTEKCKKRYKVEIKWLENGKLHQKHVRFGKEGVKDFIDHNDDKARNCKLNKMKITDDWTHPNFFTAYLLNSESADVYEAWKSLITALKLNQ